MTILFFFLLSVSFFLFPVLADLTDDQVIAIKQLLAESAQARYYHAFASKNLLNHILNCSWELGTRAQTLLELDSPRYSVTTSGAKLPPSNTNPPPSLDDVFNISRKVVSQRGTIRNSPQPFIDDDASGDPPSIGVAVTLSNWTNQQSSDGLNYPQAILNQFNYLYTVPRTSDGAISHRSTQLQLW